MRTLTTPDEIHRHIKILSVGFLALGVCWILAALWFVGAGGVREWDALGFAFVFWFVLFAIPLLLAGWGLLRLKSWARVVAIILAAIGLLTVPIVGQVFGIYALWVLYPEATKDVFAIGAKRQR